MSKIQISYTSSGIHSGQHRDVINENTIQEYDVQKRKSHWMKNRKGPSINLIDDGSFLVDRQLEDQRILMNKNKNPQLEVPTNADKTRSQSCLRKKVRARSPHRSMDFFSSIPSTVSSPESKLWMEKIRPEKKIHRFFHP